MMRLHPLTKKHTALALLLMLTLLTLVCTLPVSAVQSGMGRAGDIGQRIVEDGEGLIDRGRDIIDDMPLPDAHDGDTSDDHDGNIANDPNGNEPDSGIANDDVAPGDAAHDLSREPMDTAGILPWIIGAIVVLAIVLVVLALIPRKRQSH